MKKKQIPWILVVCMCMTLLSGCSVGRSIAQMFLAGRGQSSSGGGAVEGADLSISRPRRGTEEHMGPEGTWTVMIYLCGSDLESDGGYATANLEELTEATRGTDVTFLVETGGSYSWENSAVNPKYNQRFLVQNGRLREVERNPRSNMGDPDTLADFLRWGVENYPAYYFGVILWDHGGGSQSGIAYDELYDYDSLSLGELDQALGSVYKEMTCNFEMIGMDACLMATVETANILANYGNIMVASQEYEPGSGWDYETLAQSLQKDPDMDGEQLGRILCDAYYSKCSRWGEAGDCTLSVVDLTAIDEVLYAFDSAAKVLADDSGDKTFMAKAARAAGQARTFGGNSRMEGYSNMADLNDLMEQLRGQIGAPARQVQESLSRAVIYAVNGSGTAAGGLSVFYPYHAESWELQEMARIGVSSHYLTYISSAATDGTGGIDDFIGGYWAEDPFGSSVGSWDSYWDLYGQDSSPDLDFYEDIADGTVEIQEGPALTDTGVYYMVISRDSLPFVDNVCFSLFADLGDGTYIDIGSDSDLYMDWDTGRVEDNFTGTWACLPDDQILPITLIEMTDEYNMYTTPILYNGKESNLRIKWVWDDPYDPDNYYGSYQVAGIWSGMEEDGRANRQIQSLHSGDRITPLYYRYNEDGELLEKIEGDPYRVGDSLSIGVTTLPEGDYRYSFQVTDVYQNSFLTDFTVFGVDAYGELWYYE